MQLGNKMRWQTKGQWGDESERDRPKESAETRQYVHKVDTTGAVNTEAGNEAEKERREPKKQDAK